MTFDALDVASRAGLKVADHRVAGRPGTFSPAGVMWHYTATPPRGRNLPTLDVVKYGRSDLKGPLCHYLLGRDGTLAVITSGLANHAGAGDPDVLDAVRRQRPAPRPDSNKASGNRWFVGVEIESADGTDYTEAQRRTGARLAVALSKDLDVGPWAHIGHSEWTQRKGDPGKGWPMVAFRTQLAIDLGADPHNPTRPDDWSTMATEQQISDIVRREVDASNMRQTSAEWHGDGIAVKVLNDRIMRLSAAILAPIGKLADKLSG